MVAPSWVEESRRLVAAMRALSRRISSCADRVECLSSLRGRLLAPTDGRRLLELEERVMRRARLLQERHGALAADHDRLLKSIGGRRH